MATASVTVERPRRPEAEETEAVDRQAITIPPTAHTYDGFLAWSTSDVLPEKLRVCLLGGAVCLDMSTESAYTHVAVKSSVNATLFLLVVGENLGEYFADGILIANREAGVSNNPDGVFVTWKSFRTGRVAFRPGTDVERILEGAPDWVMEVVSNSSVDKDTRRLREAYHRAGIREYWLIDARGEELDFQILQWRKRGYVGARPRHGWLESKVFRRLFRLARSLNDRGAWLYTLEMQPAG